MIDVVTVGSGGGSIAWLAADGRLRVGPRSAGADPGPLCYGRGGIEPTTTDASLLLGRIPPHLLGGEIPLDIDLARSGFAGLARRLGLDLERAAGGVLEIAAWSQANAVRQVTTRRGLDVRDYLLVAFGGSGPLQAGRLVDILGLQGALIPPSPGNVSAFGLLTVDLKYDYVVTAVQRDDRLDLERTQGLLARPRSAGPRSARTRGGDTRSAAAIRRPALLRPVVGGARRGRRWRPRSKRGRRGRGSFSRGARTGVRLQLSDEPRTAGGRVGQPAGNGHRSQSSGRGCNRSSAASPPACRAPRSIGGPCSSTPNGKLRRSSIARSFSRVTAYVGRPSSRSSDRRRSCSLRSQPRLTILAT